MGGGTAALARVSRVTGEGEEGLPALSFPRENAVSRSKQGKRQVSAQSGSRFAGIGCWAKFTVLALLLRRARWGRAQRGVRIAMLRVACCGSTPGMLNCHTACDSECNHIRLARQ